MENYLLVKNVKKSFKDKIILDGINISIGKKEIVGLLGRNGSGKSTLMKIISGLQNASEGKVEILGFDIEKNREDALQNLGVSIEAPALYQALSGIENLKLMSNWTSSSKERLNEIIEYVGIGHKINNKVSTYSMGMKMRLMLGMVIMSKPKLVILDEPMNGLDPEGVFELRNQLLMLKEEGCSILLSSHQLYELEKLSDRILMLEGGKIIYDGKLLNENLSRQDYMFSVNDINKLIDILQNEDIKYSQTLHEKGDCIKISLENMGLDNLIEIIKSNQIKILDLYKVNKTLEDLYNELKEYKKGSLN